MMSAEPESAFAKLMKLSDRQTKQSDLATQSLLLDRRRKEEARRKEQEERERKERELHNRLIKQRLEEEQREKERQQRAEEERRRRELLIKKREQEQVQHILYGTKKPKFERLPRDEHRGRKRSGSVEDDYDSGAAALTREEKRQRKLNLEMNRGSSNGKRSSGSGYGRGVKALAGVTIKSTIDVPFAPLDPSVAGSQSVKQRLAAAPNVLTKLNTVKRDTRTIDEILQDRAKAREAKVLNGDEARSFHDWFSTKKKEKGPLKSTTVSSQASPSPSPPRTLTPAPSVKERKTSPAGRDAIASNRITPAKSSSGRTIHAAINGKNGISKGLSNDQPQKKPLSSKSILQSRSKTPQQVKEISDKYTASRLHDSTSIKRPRSSSSSVTPPPKRRQLSEKAARPENDISSEIWKLFGRKREDYVRRDVFSDDEDEDDMEAGATDLEREELRSARLAKREDEEAFEEERRHEEEKRRRRKERELKERRG